MRLTRSLIAVAVSVALMTGAIASASARTATVANLAPSVHLACSQAPCGTDGHHYWHGHYYAKETIGFPANTKVVVTAEYPSGQQYPFKQYSNPGTVYGVSGNVQSTNANGQLPNFVWAANNGPTKRTDPPGVYHLQVRVKIHGKVYVVMLRLTMHALTPPGS